MATIRLDDQISQVPQKGDEKLSEFIQSLIANLPPNRVVTHVTLDGNPIPERHHRSDFTRTLEGVKELQIRTADKAIWAATGLDIALSCVERLKYSLHRAAELFREDEADKANRFFVHCVEGMERFFESIAITRAAMNIDFSKVPTDYGTLYEAEGSLTTILKGILELQSREQYLELSECVEDELLTNLTTWERALRRLRNSHASNA